MSTARDLGQYLSTMDDEQRDVIDRFHAVYYNARYADLTWGDTRWLGHPVLKCPLDLWLYQEILHEVRPDFVIETGTAHGGSALYLAGVCDLLNHGTVYTVDIKSQQRKPKHPRLHYVQCSSTAPQLHEFLRETIPADSRVVVILDSDHTRDHVLAELNLYSGLVNIGSYLIVEDTILNGNPVPIFREPGPWEAIESFLSERDDFVIDRSKEKLLMSFNRGGYLKRVR